MQTVFEPTVRLHDVGRFVDVLPIAKMGINVRMSALAEWMIGSESLARLHLRDPWNSRPALTGDGRAAIGCSQPNGSLPDEATLLSLQILMQP